MRILEDLWFGRIYPAENPLSKNSKVKELAELVTRNKDQLLATLNEQEKDRFERLCDCQSELEQVTECETFIAGFRLAAQMMAAVFCSGPSPEE